MHIRPDEWKKLIELRDDLEGEDKALVRKLLRYVEWMHTELNNVKALLHQAVSGNYKEQTDGED